MGVVEVGRDGDDRIGDRLTQVGFCVRPELLEDHGADLLRRPPASGDVHPIVGAHFPLDGGDGAAGIGDRLTARQLPHQTFPVLGKGHDRWRGSPAFCIGDNDGLSSLHHSDTTVGRA